MDVVLGPVSPWDLSPTSRWIKSTLEDYPEGNLSTPPGPIYDNVTSDEELDEAFTMDRHQSAPVFEVAAVVEVQNSNHHNEVKEEQVEDQDVNQSRFIDSTQHK